MALHPIFQGIVDLFVPQPAETSKEQPDWYYETFEGWGYASDRAEAIALGREEYKGSSKTSFEIGTGVGRPFYDDPFEKEFNEELTTIIDGENSATDENATVIARVTEAHLDELRADLNAAYNAWVRRHDFYGGQLEMSNIETIQVEEGV